MGKEGLGKWLLTIDNADDVEMLYRYSGGNCGEAPVALVDYLHSSRLGSILFTTRQLEATIEHSGVNRVESEGLAQRML